MLRIGLERELEEMNSRVLDLLGRVEGRLAEVVEFVEEPEQRGTKRRIGYDSRLKMWGGEIEDDCFLLQARHAPVACDLRFIRSICAVANHAVRAGTLCEHLFRAFEEADDLDGERRRCDLDDAISRMAREAYGIFRQGVEVFKDRDIEHARSLKEKDEVVDRLCAEVMEIAASVGKLAFRPGKISQAALVAHYLERISDHGVDIGLRTVFMVEGEVA